MADSVHPRRSITSNRRLPFWRRRTPAGRYGYTLIEMTMAAAAASLLMGGLSSALLIAGKTMIADGPASSDSNRAGLVLGQISQDMRQALRFSERTATAATFAVPDRTGDGKPETIRYSWSNVVGEPLLYQYNGGTAVSVLDDVRQFRLSGLTRAIPGAALDMPTASSVTYEAFAEGKSNSDMQYCVVPAPAGSSQGKLLVAAVAVDGNQGSLLMSQAGWTRLAEINRSGYVGLGVWWKIASADEPSWYVFYWPGSEKSYGWIMRFAGAHPSSPINAVAQGSGASTWPSCPAVTTTTANCLVLRIGGFDKGNINVDNAGMSGHTTITVDRCSSNSDAASGGAAYATKASPGSTGTANFTITNNERYGTVTVAIAPNASP